MKKVLKISGIVYLLLFFAAIFLFYKLVVPYQMAFKEQAGFFMATSSYIAQYLQKPAILSELLGDFLTQLFCLKTYYAVIPVLLLVLVWLGFALTIKRVTKNSSAFISALLPVAVEAAFLVYMNYPLSSTISLLVAVWSAYLVTGLQNNWGKKILLAILVPLLYLLIGGHTLTFMLIVTVMDLKLWQFNLSVFVVGIVVIMLMGRLYNLTFQQSLLYPIIPGYIIPSNTMLLLMAAAVLLALICGSLKVYGWITSVLSASLLVLVMHFSYNADTEYAVKISTKAYNDKWNEVKSLSLDNKTNNPLGIYYRNLSFAREGRLAQELFKHAQMTSDGLFMDLQPGVTYLEVFSYLDVLLEVGDVSQATDCALLCQTVMPKSYSSRGIKNLAEIAMIVGDIDVANKYLDMLEATIPHKKWAVKMKECMAADSLPQEYAVYRNRMPLVDYFYQQNNWRESLVAVADANPLNVVAIDYLLSASLLNKNYQTFLSHYDRYYLNKLDRIIQVPEIYQQALLLQATDDESLQMIMEKYRIPMSMVDYYFAFVDAQAESQGDIRKLGNFAGTYWYYMVLARFNKQ